MSAAALVPEARRDMRGRLFVLVPRGKKEPDELGEQRAPPPYLHSFFFPPTLLALHGSLPSCPILARRV